MVRMMRVKATGVGSVTNRQPITQVLLTGSAWAFSGKAIAAVSGLAVNAFLARLLSPTEFGTYFLIVSITMVSALLAQCGTRQSVVRLVADSLARQRPDQAGRAVKSAFLIVVAGIVIFATTYLGGVGDWLGNQVFDFALVAGAAVAIVVWTGVRALQSIMSQVFRGLNDIRYASLLEGASTNLLLAAVLAMLWSTRAQIGLNDALHLAIGAAGASVLLGAVLLYRPLGALRPCPGTDFTKLLRISLPLFVANWAILGMMEAQIWILGVYHPAEDVAVYGAAFRTVRLISLPLIIINAVIPATIAQLYARGEHEQLENVLRGTATIAGLLALPVLILIALTGPFLLASLFGDFYARGAPVLMILCGAQMINVLTGSPGILLMMADRQLVFMRNAIASCVLAIITSLSLVDSHGVVGVGIGAATGIITINLLNWMYCRVRMGYHTHMYVRGLMQFCRTAWRRFALNIQER